MVRARATSSANTRADSGPMSSAISPAGTASSPTARAARRAGPVRDQQIGGQLHLHLVLGRLAQEVARHRQLVLLDQALAQVVAARAQERVGHGAADGDGIDPIEQRLEHLDLVRHLGPAQDGQVGPVDLAQQPAQALHLLVHEEAGRRLGHVRDHPDRRGVGAVGRAERVVDVDIGVGGQGAGEAVLVGLLARVEAQVLEQRDLPVAQIGHHLARAVADRLVGQGHVHVEQPGQVGRHRLERVLGSGLALGPAQVRRDHQARAALEAVADGRQRRAHARVVAHLATPALALVERDVEVHAQEHPLALDGQVLDVADGGRLRR